MHTRLGAHPCFIDLAMWYCSPQLRLRPIPMPESEFRPTELKPVMKQGCAPRFVWRAMGVALLFAVAGCTTWQNSDTPFQVSDSSLNWSEILYSTSDGTRLIRISILGNGHIVMRRGSGSRVLDDFAQDVESANWTDIERDEINLSRTDVQQIHQILVNRGALKRVRKLPPGASTIVQLHGRIDDKIFARASVDAPLIQAVESIIALFPPPKPGPQKP